MSKKFSDIISQIITDETPFLNEHNSITDEFAKTTGANINSYIQGKLKNASSAALSTLDKIIFFKNSETLAKSVTLGDLATFLGTGGGSNNVCWISQTDINADYSSFAEAKAAGKYIFIVKDTYVDNIELTANCIIFNFGEITTNLNECIVIGGDKETNKIILTNNTIDNFFINIKIEAGYDIFGTYITNSNIVIINDISLGNSIIEKCRITGSNKVTCDSGNNIEDNTIFVDFITSFNTVSEERNMFKNNIFCLCNVSMYGSNGVIMYNYFENVIFYFPYSFNNSNFSNNIFQFCSVDSSFSTNYDVDSIVMTGNVGQLEFSERLSSGKIWKGNSNDIPEEVDFPIGFFDATIGTGGDYPCTDSTNDIQAAWNAGKYILKQVGNITLTRHQTPPANKICKIYGNRKEYTITNAGYVFFLTNSASYLETYNCWFELTGSNNVNFLNITSGNNNCFSYNDRFDINSISTNYAFIGGWYFENPYVNIDTTTSGGWGSSIETDLRIVGTCHIHYTQAGYYTFYFGYYNSNIKIDKVLITGLCNNANGIFISASNYNNFVIDEIVVNSSSNCIFKLKNGIINRIKKLGDGTLTFKIDTGPGSATKININNAEIDTISLIANNSGYSSEINFNNLKLTNALTVTNFGTSILIWNISNSKFLSTLTVNNDNNTLTCNQVIGATSLSAGAEYNIITGNRFDGGFTDNSGNTTNELQNNI